jgi:hypothetical protein
MIVCIFFLCLPEYNVLNHVCVNAVMASKTVVADLNRGEKLDSKNYDIWHHKIQYLLDELEVFETLTNSMESLSKGTVLRIVETWMHTKVGARRIVVHALPC